MRLLPAIAWMVAIFVVSAQPTVPQLPGFLSSLTSAIGHFTVYAVLAALLWWVLGAFGVPAGRRFVIAFAGALVYGISDEWHQSFVPGRTPSVIDLFVDAIGALTGLVIIKLAARIRRLAPLIPEDAP